MFISPAIPALSILLASGSLWADAETASAPEPPAAPAEASETVAVPASGGTATSASSPDGAFSSPISPAPLEPPPRGALIAELREEMVAAIPGPETVISLYEDNLGNQQREFAINGRIFQIHVEPWFDPAYDLVDHDGDGAFETRHEAEEGPRLILPAWVLHPH